MFKAIYELFCFQGKVMDKQMHFRTEDDGDTQTGLFYSV